MERVLEIEKFRNLGLERKERIVLNHSLKKGEMGNLVIVVGANNSGKSNVLDALAEFSDKYFTERDLTTLSFEDKDRIPSLSLAVKNENEIFSYKINYKNEIEINCPKDEDAQIIKRELINAYKALDEAVDKKLINDEYKIKENLETLTKTDDISKIKELEFALLNIFNLLESRSRNYGYGGGSWGAWELVKSKCQNNSYLLKMYKKEKSKEEVLKTTFLAKYGINFIPKVYRYSEKLLSDNDLKVSPSGLSNSVFFKTLFASIDVELKEISNACNEFNRLGSKSILLTLQNKLNKKLNGIAKRFNNLYILEDEEYKFEINLESNQIFFAMSRIGQAIILAYQSTGFRWFFNLYFNLLASNNLQPGDIVIMDEPATNLHVGGQRELRNFLKEFAMKNDITIVIATHSPFLIDMDYLDEIRVVSMQNNISYINNDFSTIDLEDPDSLKPIKEALTVGNHILYDPDVKVVFVEGITDYNYMVAFKKRFNLNNLVFLPIKGVGKYGSPEFKNKQKEISKRLIKIKKHSPILMVDADGAGKAMQMANKDSELTVFTLKDISQEFIVIENLFSDSDLKSLGIKLENGKYVKHSSTSARIKTAIINNIKLSQQTEENFKKLFNYIDNL